MSDCIICTFLVLKSKIVVHSRKIEVVKETGKASLMLSGIWENDLCDSGKADECKTVYCNHFGITIHVEGFGEFIEFKEFGELGSMTLRKVDEMRIGRFAIIWCSNRDTEKNRANAETDLQKPDKVSQK